MFRMESRQRLFRWDETRGFPYQWFNQWSRTGIYGQLVLSLTYLYYLDTSSASPYFLNTFPPFSLSPCRCPSILHPVLHNKLISKLWLILRFSETRWEKIISAQIRGKQRRRRREKKRRLRYSAVAVIPLLQKVKLINLFPVIIVQK